MTIDPSLQEYLKTHRVAVLATNRKAGPPQQTLIAYQFNGEDFAISVRGFSQKAKNLMRRPDASMAVVDGSRQVIVTGKVGIISDEAEVLRLNKERMRLIAQRPEPDDELADRLRREERVVLILTPQRFYPASMA